MLVIFIWIPVYHESYSIVNTEKQIHLEFFNFQENVNFKKTFSNMCRLISFSFQCIIMVTEGDQFLIH